MMAPTQAEREQIIRTIALSYARNDLEPTSDATLKLYRKDAEHAADAVLALPALERQPIAAQIARRAKALIDASDATVIVSHPEPGYYVVGFKIKTEDRPIANMIGAFNDMVDAFESIIAEEREVGP